MISDLIEHARVALKTIDMARDRDYRDSTALAAAEWLESIARQIKEELAEGEQ